MIVHYRRAGINSGECPLLTLCGKKITVISSQVNLGEIVHYAQRYEHEEVYVVSEILTQKLGKKNFCSACTILWALDYNK